MLEYIEGRLESIEPTYIVVDHHGLGYKILTANAFEWSASLGKEIRIYVELVVREDAHTLYGFLSQEEKKLFNKLTTVKSIGPRTALSILAPGDQEGLIQAIHQENINYLTNFPGIGKKTAQQMILDLQGKLDDFTIESYSMEAQSHVTVEILEQTKEALSGLGYSAREIASVEKQLKKLTFEDTQEALSHALKLLVQ